MQNCSLAVGEDRILLLVTGMVSIIVRTNQTEESQRRARGHHSERHNGTHKQEEAEQNYVRHGHTDMRGHHGAVVLKLMPRGCYLTERVMRVWISLASKQQCKNPTRDMGRPFCREANGVLVTFSFTRDAAARL